jgi:DNA repair protein RecO (recombination protein O)
MHQKFLTRGVVLGKRSAGESNTAALLFTEDLGLVRAVARSARREDSRLRYGLEPLMQGRYTLLRGRYEWRLVGAGELSRDILYASPIRTARAGRIAKLLLRLMPGEEASPKLYRSVIEGLGALARMEAQEDADAVECVVVLRILSRLGYLPRLPALEPFVEADFFSLELAASAKRSRALLIKLINDSLSASGL